MAIGKQLSDGNPDGTSFGQDASDLISFYGATPVARSTVTVAATSTASVSISATQWGYATSAQADAIAKLAFMLGRMGLTVSS
jgi:hypothetical protein